MISSACPSLLKVGDNITTDHIMPAGAKILPYRSNIPFLSQFCFGVCDRTFPERAKEAGQSIVVGGSNYGQGSSREHAALVPLYLGVRACHRQELRPHPRGESDQRRYHAPDICRPGRL